MTSVLEEDDLGMRLPPHQRCAAHTLNLIAITDAARANRDTEYGRISEGVFKKCNNLWNKQGQSVRSADIVHSLCGRYLIRPVPTRWNSLHDSLECILRLVEEGKDIEALCRRLNIPVLKKSTDIKFIEEYCRVSIFPPVQLILFRLLSDFKHRVFFTSAGNETTLHCLGHPTGG